MFVPRAFLMLRACAATLVWMSSAIANAQLCAVPGLTGPNVTLNTPPNTYLGGVAAGANGNTVNHTGVARSGASTTLPAVGDMVLLIQVQGTDINTADTAQYGDGQGAAFARQDATVPTLPAPSPTVAYNAGTNATDGYAGGNTDNANFSAGRYEFAVVTQVVSGTQFRVRGAGAGGNLQYAYVQGAGPNQRRYQVVRVPQFSQATITGNIVPPAWDGATGGLVVLDVAGALSFNAGVGIDLNQRGFRGGGVRNIGAITAPQFGGYRALYATNLGGMKGEGFAGTPARTYDSLANVLSAVGAADGYVDGDVGRGAPGNAGGGGNQHNAGGGGGGNGGAGGNGGGSWNANVSGQSGWQTGGFGGFPAGSFFGVSRLFLGGGGGAGDVGGNGSTDPQGSGANGGGLAIIRAGSITAGAGAFISANGGNAPNTASTDSSGAGGAGGTIFISSGSGGAGGLVLTANGGNGGSTTMGAGNPEQDGPGGGGGGGVIYTTGGSLGTTASGIPGTISTASTPPIDPPNYYARAGSTGTTPVAPGNLDSAGSRAGFECPPQLTVSKSSTPTTVTSATGATVQYTVSISNAAVAGGATAVNLFDQTLPPGWTLLGVPTYNATATSTTDLGAGGEATAATLAAGLPQNNVTAAGTRFPLRATAAAPGVVPASGDNALRWGSFFLGQGSAITVTFVASIPDSATAGTYHNPAGLSFLDPQRTSTSATRVVAPLANVNANRTGTAYSNNSAFTLGTSVPGSHYSGLQAGPSAEDVVLIPDLSVSKSGTTSIGAGSTANYVIVPRNNGRAIATQTFATSQATDVTAASVPSVLGANPITVTDTLATGLSLWATPSGTNWTCTGSPGTTGTFSCQYFQATPAGAYPITASTNLPTLTVPVRFGSAACPGPVSNTATVSIAANEQALTNNTSAAVATSLGCAVNLSATKTDGAGTVTAGSTTSYTLTFANAGPAAADGAVVRDLPGVGLSSCAVTACTALGGLPAMVCPAPAGWPDLLASSGLSLGQFPSGGSIQFVVQCSVSASGL